MSEIELFENERATNYDHFVNDWIPNYQYFIDQLPQLLAEVTNKQLLVAGCGTGNEILAFLRAGNGWTITGIDPSPEMILQAREKLQDHQGVKLVEGVVSNLPTQLSFGAATLLLVLHFLKDDGSKLELLQQIANRLEPGAPFVLLDITGNAWHIRKNLQVLRYLISPEIEEEQVQTRLARIENELYHVPEERLTELLMLAGFEKPIRFYQTSVYMGWLTKKS